MTTTKRVQRANKTSSTELVKYLAVEHSNPSHHYKRLLWATELSPAIRDAIFNLFETNMSALYVESLWGWDPSEKKRELFHSKARYILIFGDCEHTNLLAFTAFRFDVEQDEELTTTTVSYEVQVSDSARRQGLGAMLMTHLAQLGSKLGFPKVMLTVFKSNDAALQFYQSIGFELDEISPSEEDEEDYLIFSRDCSS